MNVPERSRGGYAGSMPGAGRRFEPRRFAHRGFIACLVIGAAFGGGARQADSHEAQIAAWREALELDLARDVLESGPDLVEPGGALSSEGEAIALVARALFAAGEEARATSLLDGAKPSAETAGWISLERARLALLQDELGTALEHLQRAQGSAAVEPERRLLLGRVHARRGDPARADPELRAFLEAHPLHPEAPAAWHMLAQHAIARSDGASAERYRERAAAAARWQAYYRARRLQVREQPDAPLPRLGIAQLWLEAGRGESARAVLLELIELAPDFARAWSHLGQAERMRGEAAAAASAYARAIELDPENLLARYGRGTLCAERGDLAGAEADLVWIVEHGASDDRRTVQAHLLLARIVLAGGTPDDRERAEALHARYRELGGREPLEPE